MVGTQRVRGFALKDYRLRISDPDVGYLGFGREFECFLRFEVCKHHAIIHDACGAVRTKYNVGPGYWYALRAGGAGGAYANYPSDGYLTCLSSNPLIGCITGLSWCWRHRNELAEIFGKVIIL